MHTDRGNITWFLGRFNRKLHLLYQTNTETVIYGFYYYNRRGGKLTFTYLPDPSPMNEFF